MESEQIKKHCEHECVCAVLALGGIEGDRSPCDYTGCKHDTRPTIQSEEDKNKQKLTLANVYYYEFGLEEGIRKYRENTVPLVKKAKATQLSLFRMCWDKNIIELVKQVGADIRAIEDSLKGENR